jgi:hypothetical protein
MPVRKKAAPKKAAPKKKGTTKGVVRPGGTTKPRKK